MRCGPGCTACPKRERQQHGQVAALVDLGVVRRDYLRSAHKFEVTILTWGFIGDQRWLSSIIFPVLTEQ